MNVDITKALKENWIPVITTISTIAITLLNTWLSVKLLPLAQNLVSIIGRVEALEEKNTDNKPLIERFIVVEQQTKDVLKKIDNIDTNQQRMDDKLDRIIERYSLPANR